MPLSDWTPSVADVGSILRARTQDVDGNELGTFSGATRPTDVEVLELIVGAQNDAAAAIGTEVPAGFTDRARSLAALGTALSVELSYYPEAVGVGQSPYAALKVLYDERLARLQAAMQSGVGEEVQGEPDPVGGFPTNTSPAGPIVSLTRPAW